VKSFSSRCRNRTCLSTSTALDALIGIDFILAIALADSVYGTSLSTSATSDAIVGNFVCHDYIPPFFVYTYIVSQ
jgi:hypothetical protein